MALTTEQQAAADVLTAKSRQGFSATLIDGVTRSGKTEVYFEAAAKALQTRQTGSDSGAGNFADRAVAGPF